MRKHTKSALAFILFGLLILSFAVWGIGDIFRGGSARAVAEVGDARIELPEFNDELQRELRRIAAATGGRIDLDQARRLGVFDQVLDQLITRRLLLQAATDMGLVVPDEVVATHIRESPAFQNAAGAFDRGLFERVLFNNGVSEQGYIVRLRETFMREQVASALTAGLVVPEAMLRPIHGFRLEARTAQTARIARDAIPGIAQPTEAEVEAFYQENRDDYMAPEYRSLSYVTLTAEDLAEGIQVTNEALRQAFEERHDQFFQPERRSFQQFLLPDEAAARAAAEAIAGGKDFAEAAREATGGDPIPLGPISRGDLAAQAPALAEAGFALAEGAASGPASSPLGWHVMKLTGAEPAVDPGLDDVRDELSRTLALERAHEALFDVGNRLDDALAGGATLEEAAATQDLTVRRIAAVDRQGQDVAGAVVEDLPRARAPFIETAFTTPAGDQSLLTEMGADGYFLVRVDSVTPPAPRPLDGVRAEVRQAIVQQRRDAAAREQAEALLQAVEAGGDLAALAQAKGFAVAETPPLTRFDADAEAGVTQPIVNALFSLEQGEATMGPWPDGYVVAKLTGVTKAGPAEGEALDELRALIGQGLANDIASSYRTALTQRYPVEINRSSFEQIN